MHHTQTHLLDLLLAQLVLLLLGVQESGQLLLLLGHNLLLELLLIGQHHLHLGGGGPGAGEERGWSARDKAVRAAGTTANRLPAISTL